MQIKSLSEMDLTGTWLHEVKVDVYEKSTNKYLSTHYTLQRYVFEETNYGIANDWCWGYGHRPPAYAQKSKDYLYLSADDSSGFRLQSDNSLQRTSEEPHHLDEAYIDRSTYTLRKISENVQIDSGTFILNGPVSITEYSHVCAWEVSRSWDIHRSIELIVPYGDEVISMRFEIYDDLSVGSYGYATLNVPTTLPISLHIGSNATEFVNTVGSNGFWLTNVEINLIEYNDEKMSGTFSFTGQDDGEYSGEFEVYFDLKI
ncbi:hypothetical protein BTA51_23690 [Hahella sp. CCB-MM4]|nr:hypothetical protein BTA51_23690 [Hahella sp. CCB-MM4]